MSISPNPQDNMLTSFVLYGYMTQITCICFKILVNQLNDVING